MFLFVRDDRCSRGTGAMRGDEDIVLICSRNEGGKRSVVFVTGNFDTRGGSVRRVISLEVDDLCRPRGLVGRVNFRPIIALDSTWKGWSESIGLFVTSAVDSGVAE